MQEIKPGDVLYCEVNSFGGKENRPVIVLEINGNILKCLRITSIVTKNKSISILMDFFDCCDNVKGYIYTAVDNMDLSLCHIANCKDCKISYLLKVILKSYGINIQ